MSRGRVFAGAVLLQMLLLGGLYLGSQARVAAGTVILLQAAPVDPYSMFRGRYAIIRLAISDLPEGVSLPRGEPLWTGRVEDYDPDAIKPVPWEPADVYVTIAPGDPFWYAVAISLEAPQDVVFIAGKKARGGGVLSGN